MSEDTDATASAIINTAQAFNGPETVSRHPLAEPDNRSGACGMKAGDWVRYIDGRTGIVDEFLPDGDAYVRWDSGGYATVKWNRLQPASIAKARADGKAEGDAEGYARAIEECAKLAEEFSSYYDPTYETPEEMRAQPGHRIVEGTGKSIANFIRALAAEKEQGRKALQREIENG